MKRILKGFFMVSILAFFTQVTAQGIKKDAANVSKTDTLTEVMITANRMERAVFLAPYSIDKVLSPAQDLRLTRTMPEALGYTPGIFIQKTNHGGGSPFLRGLTGNQTLLLWDGIRVNNAIFRFGPNQYPNLLDAYALGSVEVLKGSGSTQYGSDAMGGVIQVLSRETEWQKTPTLKLRAGTRFTTQDMEYTGRAAVEYSRERFGFSGGFSTRKFGDLYGGKNTGKQSPSGYTEANWDAKAKWKLNDKYTVTAAAQQVNQSDVPLYHRVALENFEYYDFQPQRLLLSYARLEAKYTNGTVKGWRITPLYKKSVEGRRYHRNGNASYFAEQDEVATWGLVAETDLRIARNWQSTQGAEWYSDYVNSSRTITNNNLSVTRRGLYPEGSTQQNRAVYSLHQFDFGKLKIDAGLRYNAVTNNIPGRFLSLPGDANGKDASLTSSAFVGNVGLSYEVAKQQVLYGSFNTGFRAPGIDDLGTLGLVDFRYEVPAYDLQPEKSGHSEIGYRFKNRVLHLHVAAFYMHLTNLISRVRSATDSIQGYPVFYKTNDQQSFVRGLEGNLQLQLSEHFRFQIMAATQYGQNLSRNEPMRRIPPAFGLQNISFEKSHWTFSLEHQWAAKQTRLAQGDKDDNRIPKGGTSGWQILNAYAAYTVPAITLRAAFNNITDQDYRTHGSGINGMGRSLTFSALFTFTIKK